MFITKYKIIPLICFTFGSFSVFALIGGKSLSESKFELSSLVAIGGYCSAVKISERKILTAAHCLHTNLSYEIKPVMRGNGSIVLRSSSGITSDYQVVSYREHPTYRVNREKSLETGMPMRKNHYDVAIIEVDREIENSTIGTINLDEVPERADLILTGQGCEVNNGEVVFRKRFSYGDTKKLNPGTGMRAFIARNVTDISPLSFYIFTLGAFYTHQVSLCPGDSGGPVLYNGDIVAINSGILYGKDKVYGKLHFHTNLSYIRSWISAELSR